MEIRLIATRRLTDEERLALRRAHRIPTMFSRRALIGGASAALVGGLAVSPKPAEAQASRALYYIARGIRLAGDVAQVSQEIRAWWDVFNGGDIEEWHPMTARMLDDTGTIENQESMNTFFPPGTAQTYQITPYSQYAGGKTIDCRTNVDYAAVNFQVV